MPHNTHKFSLRIENNRCYPHLEPACLRSSSLCPVPRACIWQRSPLPFPLPLPPFAYTKVPIVPWVVRPFWGPLYPLYFCLFVLVCFSVSLHFLELCFAIGWPFTRRSENTGRLHSLAVTRPIPSPPNTQPWRNKTGYPPPPLPTNKPSPLLYPSSSLRCDPILLIKFVVHSVGSICYTHILQSC